MDTNKKDINKIDECIQHTLDILVSEKQFALSGYALRSLTVDRLEDYIHDVLLYSLHTLTPAENLKEETHTVTMHYPATWWQMFKEQYFSEWFKKRCPIRYNSKSETVTFTAYNLYPKFPDFVPEKCGNAVQTIHKCVAGGSEE
jgi:hypothetical protein